MMAFQLGGGYACHLLKIGFPHLQQVVEEGDILGFVINNIVFTIWED